MHPAPAQLSLFGHGNSQRIISSAGFVAGMKAAMRGVVEASGKSRDQVVDEMNRIVGLTGKGLCKGSKNISRDTLEKWLADAERGQLPDLWGLHVLILATGNRLHPLEVWLNFFDCSLLDAFGRKKLEYAELELTREPMEKRRRRLKAELLEGRQ
jgi:hypothetical protein